MRHNVMRIFFVTGFTLGVVLSLLLVLGLCLRSQKERAEAVSVPQPAETVATSNSSVAPASNYVDRLQRLEADSQWGDLLVAAFEESVKVSKEARTAAIRWLEGRLRSGRIPVLFCLARLHWLNGEEEPAIKCFMTASIAGQIDAARCSDPTSAGAVAMMERHFEELMARLHDRDTERRALRYAFELEERLRDREPAHWIAAHGLESFRTASTTAEDAGPFVADDVWQERRAEIRLSYRVRLGK